MAKGKTRTAREDVVRGKDKLFETMEKHFRLVLEGHATLDKELKDFRHEMRNEISSLKLGQRVMSDNVKDLAVKVDRLEDKYDKNFEVIMQYLSRIDAEIQDLKKRLTGKAEVERLERLEERVAHIELVVKKIYGKNSN